MEVKEQLKGVPGMLRPFKEYLVKAGLPEGTQIVYYGCPGTCTPFIELLAFATRDLPVEQVFVPFLNEEQARVITPAAGIGMQIGDRPEAIDPGVVVVMGGLAMPNVEVSADETAALLAKYSQAVPVGICFMSMFEKAGWTDKIGFDLLIDATLDPVTVYSA
ncbi:DUF2124 domain-containing protein [Methanofollis formosanus]|uniref:DUF2124 domain-containing protein n=1 Tax=Methanofollis formosanus TaxID=299308 RepID=A0A8G1A2N8_9EURY|nr:DUF2124 domain-containing protein [Methanofollis formosanus]QYZ79450.1 DUF2124 domain-containing protein [Methanofollis formosanus]